jgi:Zn-dependent oligopeptidase
VAERLRATILSRGSSQDPVAGFAAFLGRAPGIAALLVKRGLADRE